jgi:hypothetical protein
VAVTVPEVAVKFSESAYPLPELKDTSNPAGAVTVRFPDKVDPETVKLAVEDAVP